MTGYQQDLLSKTLPTFKGPTFQLCIQVLPSKTFFWTMPLWRILPILKDLTDIQRPGLYRPSKILSNLKRPSPFDLTFKDPTKSKLGLQNPSVKLAVRCFTLYVTRPISMNRVGLSIPEKGWDSVLGAVSTKKTGSYGYGRSCMCDSATPSQKKAHIFWA